MTGFFSFTSSSAPITVTPYTKRSRHLVRDLMSRNYCTHVHLDWHDSDHWMDLEGSQIRLAWQGGTLVGLLALSEPLNGACWIRMAGVQDHRDPQAVLGALWTDMRQVLAQAQVRQVAILLIRDWPAQFLGDYGFVMREDIITLKRSDSTPPQLMQLPEVSIRITRSEDISTLAAIDHRAFVPPWQISREDVRQAERVAEHSTVAVVTREGVQRIVGYQMSTLYFDGCHLARLAVDPDAQNLGVGTALVGESLRYFMKRGVYVMTVNTQATNAASQHVYEKLGFHRNGYDLPVYAVNLA
ncbi:MAG: GNAT family N-acetyltransferase [Pleurocapsa minor GSE-CHR-MK-17-07R]|jgi:ribosomal protein S18 acetylase RimI-like enzyme|nr:GNAT family N-acetyltransferase [Pleurocapsa minor GSE-CHR-MK 17-07R]